VGDQRLEALHHQRGHGRDVGRDAHGADGRERDLEHRRRERHGRLHPLRPDEEARLAGIRYTRALVPGLRRPGEQPARAARPRLPPVPGDPRRWAHLGRSDGCRACAGRLRSRLRIRAGPRAVRQADRVVPGDPLQARRHGNRDRSRTSPRPKGGLAQGSGASVRA